MSTVHVIVASTAKATAKTQEKVTVYEREKDVVRVSVAFSGTVNVGAGSGAPGSAENPHTTIDAVRNGDLPVNHWRVNGTPTNWILNDLNWGAV